MNTEGRPVGDDDIQGAIDGRLDPDRQAAVDAYLDANPSARARVSVDRAIRDELRSRLGPVAAEPVPPRLRIASIRARRRAATRTRLGLVAACASLLAVGAGGGWEARGLDGPPARMVATTLPDETSDAIAAHRVFVVETAHPVEVGAAQQAHLVQWLSRRVGQKLTVPDLSAQGYELMGGRVLPSGGGTAAQFMYEDGTGGRLTIYVKADAGQDTAFRFERSGGYSAFSWVDGGLGFAMVAGTDRTSLLGIAEATYRQLDPTRSPGAGRQPR